MLSLFKYLSSIIFTFIVLKYYLDKSLNMRKIIELTVIISIGLIIIDYLIQYKDGKEPFVTTTIGAPIDTTTTPASTPASTTKAAGD